MSTQFGKGFLLNTPAKLIDIEVSENARRGHMWCFGTTGVGKTRLLESLVEQDIEKGYSVVIIDPKGDIDLFSKITQLAFQHNRKKDLMLVTPIFPSCSAKIDPLSKFYLPEELVAHITSGVSVGKEPYFFNLAYEVSLVVVNALLLLEKQGKTPHSFNLYDIKKNIGHDDLGVLRDCVNKIKGKEAKDLVADIEQILASPVDSYSQVSSSLRVALTELTTGHVGKIIGKAHENRFIKRLEQNKGIILVVQLGSLLTKKAAYTAGKVILSMLQAFAGRRFMSGRTIAPKLSVHIDEAQSVLYHGIEELFAKAGGAGVFLHGYCQSISQIYAEMGSADHGNAILDNCNTKVFMRCPDAKTAQYISIHLGDRVKYSPLMGIGTQITIRPIEDARIKPSQVLGLSPREYFLTTYSGIYQGKTTKVKNAFIRVTFPQIN